MTLNEKRAIRLQKLSKEFSLQRRAFDGIWLQEQVIKKRLHPDYLEAIPIVTEAIEEVFPGMWDVHIQLSYSNQRKYDRNLMEYVDDYKVNIRLYPVIRFDNFYITNSVGYKVLLKDIFVKIGLNPIFSSEKKDFNFERIQGARTTFTLDEFSSGYLHSHLQTRTALFTAFSNFCTGTGEINMITMVLNSQGFDKGLFKNYMFQLQSYMEWESIEGGPHRKIKDIFKRIEGGNIHYFTNEDVTSIANNIIFYNKINDNPPKIKWKIENNRYTIVDDETFEEFCRYKGKDKDVYNKHQIAYRDLQGKYYPLNAEADNVKIPDEYMPFQGEKYIVKVTGLLEKSFSDFYIHPKIKKFVKLLLENGANKEQIRTSIIKGLNSNNRNARTFSGQNKILV